jgi:hypothetical protein
MTRKRDSLTRQARFAYNQGELARICTLPEASFGTAFGMQTTYVEQRSRWAPKDAQPDYYHFRDNGSRVLAVAHLDTVVTDDRRTPHFRMTQMGPVVTGGSLDDRLGAYVILRMLPRLGITCDWLLSVGEESCESTAAYFTPGKDYDWIIEFDRMGTDVVMYQYENEASRRAVRASGATVGKGSFSDIAVLDHLGVKGFNWGVGYRGNYHSPQGYAYLNDTLAMVGRFQRFHAQNADVTMPHEPEWRIPGYHRFGSADQDECEVCRTQAAVDPDSNSCTVCGCCQDCYLSLRNCPCYTERALSSAPVMLLPAAGGSDEEDEEGSLSKD